jgi:hypothetical protein
MCEDFNEDDRKFLDRQKTAIALSGARVDIENQKIDELSRQIRETSSSLMLFL